MIQENVDYYIENGRYIFTEKYLLSRGKCCKFGCRHCPYRDNNMLTPGSYIWRSKNVDYPVNVLEFLGKGSDGREYAKIEGTTTAVPVDELIVVEIQIQKERCIELSSKPPKRRLF